MKRYNRNTTFSDTTTSHYRKTMIPDKANLVDASPPIILNDRNGAAIPRSYNHYMTVTSASALKMLTNDVEPTVTIVPVSKRKRSNSIAGPVMTQTAEWPTISPSTHSENTINPIRRIVDVMNIQPNPDKPLIKLNIGDPTICGILPTHSNVTTSVADTLASGKYNGYGPAIGFPEVRQALADHVTCPAAPVTADDIVLTSGCSHALQLAIEVLANPGQNILVPRPGFPLYVTLMRPHGIQERFYNLLADRGWEADLKQMESLIDERTAAIVVNNPSNPCGAVFTKNHLENILKLAEKYRVPIIADEIYGNMVYADAKFHPLATLRPKVPILTCDGISKRYLVPGWRLGWLIVHDVNDCLKKVRIGVRQLAQKIVGPCALMQGSLPAILKHTPVEFFERTRRVLQTNAETAYAQLSNGVPGLKPVKTHGAMYMMIGLNLKCFPRFSDELQLVQALIAEESVYCLPGTAFNYPGAFRIVLTNKPEHMTDACTRIAAFCHRHYVAPPVDDNINTDRFSRTIVANGFAH